jgi:hypothetical protein
MLQNLPHADLSRDRLSLDIEEDRQGQPRQDPHCLDFIALSPATQSIGPVRQDQWKIWFRRDRNRLCQLEHSGNIDDEARHQ